MKYSLVLLLCFFSATGLSQSNSQPNVIWVVIDGVRYQDWDQGGTNDFGDPVSPENLFPHLKELSKKGRYFSNGKISNPAAISLPAYSDMFVGRRQEGVVSNHPKNEMSEYPTIFDVLSQSSSIASKQVGIFSSWKPLCKMASAKETPLFFRSCGWNCQGPTKSRKLNETSKTI